METRCFDEDLSYNVSYSLTYNVNYSFGYHINVKRGNEKKVETLASTRLFGPL